MADALATIARRLRATPRHADGGTDALRDLIVIPALREAIIGNLLAPGERLPEVALAARLGVSRTPVREAFSQLEREGLVTMVPRSGAFVREVTARDVEETYAVRAALEALAVQLATQRLTPLGTAQLDDVLGDMATAVQANDEVEYTAALDRFYGVVMTLADNTTLHVTHQSLLGPVRRLRRMAMSQAGRMTASYEYTVMIRDAIVNGDPRGPELMRQQLANACEAAMAALNVGR